MHLAREVVLARCGGAAVEADPDPQQRIGEAVALGPRCDEIHVLEPRQVILRRSWRPLQPLRDLGERQPFFLAEDLEDGFERAVAAGAVEPQLVAETTLLRETALGREQ